MSQGLQLALLVLIVVILYIISSRWRPADENQRIVRLSYWIGLAVVLLILVLYAILRSRNG
jgi:multisubunit Na+/H+ antiporter MnhB subunit